MRRPRYQELVSPQEETIKRIKEELYEARRIIINLMPEEAQTVLNSYSSCASRKETYGWQYNTAEMIIALAKKLPPEGGSYLSDRAYCPLCGEGSSSPYESGFTFPEGLRRHLVGYGNMHQCNVMEAANRLAGEYWSDRFHAAEKAEQEQKQVLKAQRKISEILYHIAPALAPQLIDEGFFYGTTPRNQSEFDWAEQRLADLGFQITCEANVKSYISEHENWDVYADPRANGEISFTVYRKPFPKQSRTPLIRRGVLNSFNLKDSWKHDIRGKYESRLAKAIGK
jgi:hypothetical protein